MSRHALNPRNPQNPLSPLSPLNAQNPQSRPSRRGAIGTTALIAAAAATLAVAGSGGPTLPGPPPSPSSRTPSAHAGAASVLGLGDSVTAGTACGCTPFVERFADLLTARDGRATVATNLGVPGLTTTSLAQQLAQTGPARSTSSADLVVLTIGANDLGPLEDQWEGSGCAASCIAPAVNAMARGLGVDLARIRALGPSGQRVEVTTYWNVFEDGDVADEQRGAGFAGWSDRVTVAANQAICRTARTFGDRCVDLYAPFLRADGSKNPTALLAADGDHPNAAGHEVIARALLAATPH